LDIGCGPGFFSVAAARAGARVTGVDTDSSELEAAARYAEACGVGEKCSFLRGDFNRIELAPGSFDVVLCFDVIEHVREDLRFVRKIHSVAAPGGVLILSTQNAMSLDVALNYPLYNSYRSLRRLLGLAAGGRWVGYDHDHVRFYWPVSLMRVLENGGFRVERWGGSYILPYWIPVRMVQWARKVLGRRDSPGLFFLSRNPVIGALARIDGVLSKTPLKAFAFALACRARRM